MSGGKKTLHDTIHQPGNRAPAVDQGEPELPIPEAGAGNDPALELPPESPVKNRRWSRVLLMLLQAGVSVGLLSWIGAELVRRDVMTQLSRVAEPGWFIAGVAAVGISICASIVRWSIFLHMLDIPLGWTRTTRIWLIGLFFDLLFFGPMGGDAARILLVIREYPRRKTAATLSVFVDHMSGFAALLAAGGIFTASRAEAFLANPVTAGLFLYLMGFLTLSVLGIVLCIVMSRVGNPEKMPMPRKARALLTEVHFTFELLTRRWQPAVAAVGISFISLFAHFASFYYSGKAVGAKLTAWELFSVAPIIDVITMLPISVSGLGVREKGFEHLLHAIAGVPMAQATLLSLGGFACTVFWGILGGILLTNYRSSKGEKAQVRLSPKS